MDITTLLKLMVGIAFVSPPAPMVSGGGIPAAVTGIDIKPPLVGE